MRHTLHATLARLLLTSIALLSTAGFARAQGHYPVTGFESITYQPRQSPQPYPHPYSHPSGAPSSAQTQLHIGFFAPSEFASTELVTGFRGGAGIGPHVQIGAEMDWHYKNMDQAVIVSGQPLPTGGSAQVTRVLSRASSNLIPLLGYIQVSGPRSLPVIPYVGAGAGYEAYFLSAYDYATGAHFDAEYGGFAWQGWAGMQLRLSAHTRLVSEAFLNQADVGRYVDVLGVTYREAVNLDGAGMRFGLNWGF